MNYLTSVFFNTANGSEFLKGILHSINNLAAKDGIYAGDNLFTYGRNLSFLEDERLMESHKKHAQTGVEKAILWRMAVVVWGAFHGMRLGGGLLNVHVIRA